MATFTDMFQNGGQMLTDAFGNPWLQLGMQLMAASGQMPQGTTTGQRLAQAGQGFMQQRSQQQELDQQKMLRQYQMSQLQRQQQQAQQEAETRRIVQEKVKSDPTLLAQYPLARAVLESTGDYGGIKDLTELGPKGPGAPKMPWQYQQFDPQGNATQYTYDPSSGGYQAGATYRPPQQQNVDVRKQGQEQGRYQWETEQQFKERQAAERSRQWGEEQARLDKQAQTAADKANTAAAQELRKAEKAVMDRKIDRVNLQGGYRGAVKQIDDNLALISQIVNHPGLDKTFGIYSKLPTVPGSDAANVQALIKKFQSGAGLSELVRLGKNDVTLTPVSNVDIKLLQDAAANLDYSQSADNARQQFMSYADILTRAKGEADTTFSQLDSLYNVQPAGDQQGAPQGQAAPKTKAEYDALPSGTIYIDPATGRTARKR